MRALILLTVSPLAACLNVAGDPCSLASDCQAGLVCSLDGVCATFEQVSAGFDVTPSVDVITHDTADASDATASDGADGCRPVAGVFAASTPPCADAAEVRTVRGIALAAEGHGLAQLATVANQVIADGFDKGEISLALHVDGELRPGCAASLAWIRGPADRNPDCTAVFTDAMPFDIPNLVATRIDDAVLDPLTNRLSGIVDKAALLASMNEALRDVADRLIVLDVDTDGDQIPDKASAIVELTF